MKKGSEMTESAVIILGAFGLLGLIAILATVTIAIVYNKGLSIKASDIAVEVRPNPINEKIDSIAGDVANNPDSPITR